MNKLIAIAIVIGLVLSSAVRADGGRCTAACSSDQEQCLSRLGVKSASNCGDGFRLCVQRCDPRRMNTSYLESDAARRSLYRQRPPSHTALCTNRCALSARGCVEAGNNRNDCRAAQLACEDRCDAN